jgi:hypothetical protein
VSKKLAMTVVSQALTAPMLILNALLDMKLSEAVQLALVGQAAAAITSYLVAQGLVDKEEAKHA